jgi:hypothetical protein
MKCSSSFRRRSSEMFASNTMTRNFKQGKSDLLPCESIEEFRELIRDMFVVGTVGSSVGETQSHSQFHQASCDSIHSLPDNLPFYYSK